MTFKILQRSKYQIMKNIIDACSIPFNHISNYRMHDAH